MLVDGESIRLFKDGIRVPHGKRDNDTYESSLELKTGGRVLMASNNEDWYQKYGHVLTRVIESMAENQVVDDLAMDDCRDNTICESCARYKGYRVPYPSRRSD